MLKKAIQDSKKMRKHSSQMIDKLIKGKSVNNKSRPVSPLANKTQYLVFRVKGRPLFDTTRGGEFLSVRVGNNVNNGGRDGFENLFARDRVL